MVLSQNMLTSVKEHFHPVTSWFIRGLTQWFAILKFRYERDCYLRAFPQTRSQLTMTPINCHVSIYHSLMAAPVSEDTEIEAVMIWRKSRAEKEGRVKMWACTDHCSGTFYQTCKASLGVQDVWNVGKQWTQLGTWTHRTLLSLSLSYVNDRFWWSHELFSDDCDFASTWWLSKRNCSHPVSNCDVGVLIMQNLRNPRLTVFPFWWFMTLLASDHLSRTQQFSFVLAFLLPCWVFFVQRFQSQKTVSICQHVRHIQIKEVTIKRFDSFQMDWTGGKHPALKTGPHISKPRGKKSDSVGCTSVIIDTCV